MSSETGELLNDLMKTIEIILEMKATEGGELIAELIRQEHEIKRKRRELEQRLTKVNRQLWKVKGLETVWWKYPDNDNTVVAIGGK